MVLRGFYYPLAFHFRIVKIISKHLLSQFSRSVWLFVTPWTAARQASLSIPNSRSSLRLMSIESVMPSSHLILCHPLLLLPPIPPSIKVFSTESTLRMRWPEYWSFSFSIIPSKEILGLISFRMDWLDLHNPRFSFMANTSLLYNFDQALLTPWAPVSHIITGSWTYLPQIQWVIKDYRSAYST